MREEILNDEHLMFRESVRTFIAKEIEPHYARWEEQGRADRSVWEAAGAAGLLGLDMPQRFGGGGSDDYRFQALLAEELARAGTYAPCLPLHNEIVGPYLRTLTTPEQAERWLPGFCSGSLVTGIAITEPGAGSDVNAIRTSAVQVGDRWILNGSKTFVSNGHTADLFLVVARTPPTGRSARGPSATLLAVEADRPGFTRGRKIDKIGMRALDTAELFFEDVEVPAENLLGRAGRAFAYLMRNLVQERMWIGVSALAAAERTFEQTLRYAGERSVFGQAVGHHQYNRFVLAELATALAVARSHTDRAVLTHAEGRLTAEEAAMVKWWNTELCQKVVDRCLQLHGAGGVSQVFKLASMYAHQRTLRLADGPDEVHRDQVGRLEIAKYN
jgi:acyl-CoA dehydrogenase